MVEAASDAVRDWPGAWLRLAGGWVANIKIGGLRPLTFSKHHALRPGRSVHRPPRDRRCSHSQDRNAQKSQCQTRSRNRVAPPQCAVQAAGTASDPLFIAVVNQWGDAALLRKAKQDAADMTDKTHIILIARVSDVGADARSSSFYLRTKGRNCVGLEAVSSRPEIQCRGEGAPVVIPTRFTKDVRADFRAQNRLDFRRLVRIGVAMGRPSHRWKRKRFKKRRKTACGQ